MAAVLSRVEQALVFATAAHAGHTRKYTGQDYIVHPIAVAGLVSTVPHTDAMLAAALLHDTVEDAGVELDRIREQFGQDVAELVDWLTDVSRPEDGPRAVRKAIDRQRKAGAPAAAQTLMLADMIDNGRTIAQHDPAFARVYLPEKALLLDVLRAGDRTLWARAHQVLLPYSAGVSLPCPADHSHPLPFGAS